MKSVDGYEIAKDVYENGGYVKPIAILALSGDNIPSSGIRKGTKLNAVTMAGTNIEGVAYEDMPPGSSFLKFQYPTYDISPPDHNECKVGGLPSEWQETNGCLKETGTVGVDGGGIINYTYNPEEHNENGITIRDFSIEMQSYTGNRPYKEFAKYNEYYGRPDYADEWIMAAFEGRNTNFGGNGGADFSMYGFDGKNQAIMKGTAYISDYMKVIQQFEEAIDKCEEKDGDGEDMKAWDNGVAFYTGSMVGPVPSEETGHLLYGLAQKRCANFKTCGEEANQLDGVAYINLELLELFKQGQYHIGRGECEPLRNLVDRIVSLMAIPVMQGTLRYAYKVGKGTSTTETAKAESAVFAAGVLPRVHACSPSDAKIIYDNMRVGATSTNFEVVLKAFENNYDCMSIAGWEVGAIYDSSANGGEGGYLYQPKQAAAVASDNGTSSG